MNNNKFIIAIILVSFTIMASCSGCAFVAGTIGLSLVSKNIKEVSRIDKKNPSKGKRTSTSSSQPSNKSVDEAIKPLEQFIVEFHNKVDEGDFDAVYNSFGQAFKDKVSRESVTTTLGILRERLGKLEKLSRYNLEIERKETFTTLTFFYNGKYNNSNTKEEFTFALVRDEITLYGVKISPEGGQNDMEMGNSPENNNE